MKRYSTMYCRKKHSCSALRFSSVDLAVDLAIELKKPTANSCMLSKSNWFHTGFSCYKLVKVPMLCLVPYQCLDHTPCSTIPIYAHNGTLTSTYKLVHQDTYEFYKQNNRTCFRFVCLRLNNLGHLTIQDTLTWPNGVLIREAPLYMYMQYILLKSRSISISSIRSHVVYEWQVELYIFCSPVSPVEIE